MPVDLCAELAGKCLNQSRHVIKICLEHLYRVLVLLMDGLLLLLCPCLRNPHTSTMVSLGIQVRLINSEIYLASYIKVCGH